MRRAVSKFIPGKLARPPGHDSSFPLYKIDSSSVDDFYISLDSPHKSWLPGEEISGQVILILKKHLANIAIEFCLAGYIKINALPHLKLKTVKRTLFNHNIRIYGPDPDLPRPNDNDEFVNGLYKGEHRFPFIVKLPKKRIFTSIDFGKGAIEYVLKTSLRSADDPISSNSPCDSPGAVSTDFLAKARHLTRFNGAAYTSEKIISLVNPIDVADLPPPKPKRLIINDPRRNKKLLRVESSTSTINTFSTLSSNNSDTDSNVNLGLPSNGPATTTLTLPPSHTGNTPTSLHNAHVSPGNSAPSSFSPSLNADHSKLNNIRVSMELPQSGFLRGELIPIKLNIHHLKKIQDTKGIIVTLVRVCRLDYGPDGLYESFRKDLLQLVIPLFVDPNTFQSEINTSLRVPPDAFPTISGCPMVSFQYFIEVMLNLSGKSLSVDGPSDHPKSNLAPSDDMLSAGPGISPGNQGNYTYHAYQNRSEFINTDKFKRLKKFLQITSEVVIGTHRLDKLSTTVTPPGGLNQNLANGTRRSSSSSASNSASPSTQAHAHIQTPHTGNANVIHSRVAASSNIGSIPESSPMNNFTPPYLRDSQAISPLQLSPLANAPTYEDIISDVSLPPQPNLSEKERMRLHEQSLLPSEPQFDTSDTEDRETVSPVDPRHDILDDIVQSNGLSSDTVANIQHDGSNTFLPSNAGGSRTPLQDMPDPMSSMPNNFDNETSLWDQNDLYEPFGQENGHDTFGPNGPHEFVPNYDTATNDRLVVQHTERQEQEH